MSVVINKNKILFLIILSVFLLSFPLKTSALEVHMEKRNGLNRICDKNECVYYCAKRRLPGPEGNCELAKEKITNSCYAGLARILASADPNNWNSVSITEDMLNSMFYSVCKGDGTSNNYTNLAPRSDYRHNATIWNDAKAAYYTVKNIENKQKKVIISPSGGLNFDKNGIAKIKIKYTTQIGTTDLKYKYKAYCEVTNGKIAANNSGWKSGKYNISSGTEITVKATEKNKPVTVECNLYYKYKKPNFYDCQGDVQDFASKGTTDIEVDSDITSVKGIYNINNLKTIKVIKKDENGNLIGGTKFALYKNENCSGKAVETKTTNASGEVNFNLENIDSDTTYCVKEIKAAPGYDLVPKSITGNIKEVIETESSKYAKIEIKKGGSQGYEVTFIDQSRTNDCVTDCNAIRTSGKNYDDKKADIEKLYSSYYSGNNGLLNFTESINGGEEGCEKACKPVNCYKKSISCLEFDLNVAEGSDFNSDNLSCYTDIINNTSDDNKLYCFTSISIKPNMDIKEGTIRTYSGQMYFDLSKYDNSLLNGTLNKTCYSLTSIDTDKIEDLNDVTDYIKVNFENKSDNEEMMTEPYTESDPNKNDDEDIYSDVTGNVGKSSIVLKKSDNNKKFTSSNSILLSVPEVWSSFEGKIADLECDEETGKCTPLKDNEENYRNLGYGIISSLDSEGKQQYKFSVVLSNLNIEKKDEESEATCLFETRRQILDKNAQLNLEFREIDTKNPFTKKVTAVDSDTENRNTMTNWCYDVKKIDRSNETKANLSTATYIQRYYEMNKKEELESELKRIGNDGTILSNFDFYKDGVINEVDSMVLQQILASKTENTSCSNDNPIVEAVIKNGPNSSGKKYDYDEKKYISTKPKYKIILNSQLMKDIAKGSDDTIKSMNLKYDKFNLECNEENICTSKLLTYLKDTKKVLTINYSTKRKI